MGSLLIGSCDYYNQVKANAENGQVFHHKLVSGPSRPTEEGSSSAGSSNRESRMSSGENSSEEELFVIEQLNERLTWLEEEAQEIKQDFQQTIQERKQLMNEIYQQFQLVRCRDQVTPDKFCKLRRKGPGLSQVLCQDDSNLPSIIIRDLKAKAVKCSRR